MNRNRSVLLTFFIKIKSTTGWFPAKNISAAHIAIDCLPLNHMKHRAAERKLWVFGGKHNWKWPAASLRNQTQNWFSPVKHLLDRTKLNPDCERLRAALRSGSRWSRGFGCRLLGWTRCNQRERYRQEESGSSWKCGLSLTHSHSDQHVTQLLQQVITAEVRESDFALCGQGCRPSGKCPSSALWAHCNSSRRMTKTVWLLVWRGAAVTCVG